MNNPVSFFKRSHFNDEQNYHDQRSEKKSLVFYLNWCLLFAVITVLVWKEIKHQRNKIFSLVYFSF